MSSVFPISFYQRHPEKVAPDLLGHYLVRSYRGKIIKGVITETEAYYDATDSASHARFGKTRRNRFMFERGGKAYIYLIYGMYHCFNVVTEKRNQPSAVLIRALKVKNTDYSLTNGPGKLTRYLRINMSLNGSDLTRKDKVWIEKNPHRPQPVVETTPRIGVDYAGEAGKWLWRFVLKINP